MNLLREGRPVRTWVPNPTTSKEDIVASIAKPNRIYHGQSVGERWQQPDWETHDTIHLTDELSNALNPGSGLPRQLLLTPEQMQQMGMEKAVRHAADINAWRAAQKAEANALLAQSPAVHGVREYAENNPKGLRWVEIKKPNDLPEGWVDMTTDGSIFRGPNGEIVAQDPRRAGLAEQLKYEGDTMGHCVGGYCDAVASGKSRIYSLRDAKGEPHVTVESSPGRWNKDYAKSLRDPTGKFETFDDLVHHSRIGNGDYDRVASELADTHGIEKPPHQIVQIKGKQNKKPNDEYLPFVQDFVKNHPEGGAWGEVGDFGNTGFERISDYGPDIQNAARAKYPEAKYLTAEEIQPFVDATFVHKASGGLIKEPKWEQLEGGYIFR